MFEQYQNKETPEVGPKILVGSVAGLILSMGLCGVGFGASQTKLAPLFLMSGVAVLGVSVIGVVVGLVWTIVEAIASRGK